MHRQIYQPAWMLMLATWLLSAVSFGAELKRAGAGVPFDLQGFAGKEINSGKQSVVVPPGRYRVTPKSGQHLVLKNLKDIQIIADGVEMICTETTRALTIARCTNVTLRGQVIDYG